MANHLKIVCFACLLLLAPAMVRAQWTSELSADLPDPATMATQLKVAELYDAGKYERAFFIYENELAPIGDKYAQYMVGYMYLTGTGVAADPVLASAWYRLAAERNTPEFIQVRDQLFSSLSDADKRRSDTEYFRLREKYCDLAVLLDSVKRGLREFETKTGSRLRSDSRVLTIIESRGDRVLSGDEYYGRLRADIEDRLKLMQEIGDFQDLETDPDRIDLRELERRVRERISSLR